MFKRLGYLRDSGVLVGVLVRSGNLFYQSEQAFPSGKTEQTHTLDEVIALAQLLDSN